MLQLVRELSSDTSAKKSEATEGLNENPSVIPANEAVLLYKTFFSEILIAWYLDRTRTASI